ncbi:hypothetical protein [Pseudocolwellia agarivorans]|uniref:hypothetical protein n=1 Tax=Pseudocolwellia agarivorans TaxID=1911682 RepID=UPI00158B7269|nr:hypothetical protein [Pseudocolwellia agarivorans]
MVKSVCSETIVQTELGKRVDVSCTTIDEGSALVKVNRSRKARKAPEEFSDNF